MNRMGNRTFDIPQMIAMLLERIEDDRDAYRKTQYVRDEFNETCRQRDEFIRPRDTLLSQMTLMDEPERSQAAEGARRMSEEFHRLNDVATSQWEKYKETTSFIGPFNTELSLLSRSLPLTEPWDRYREFIEKLIPVTEPCWGEGPAGSSLDLLKKHLKEMATLWKKTRNQNGHVVGGADRGRSSGNPDAERIKSRIRKIWKEADGQNERLTIKQLCLRLDAHKIELPERVTWNKQTWKDAYHGKSRGAVQAWLSRVKSSTPRA